MVKRQFIHGWPGKIECFALLQKLSVLDTYYHSTQYLSSLQVLHPYLLADQGGA